MNNKRKNILAIATIALILLIAGAAIFVSARLSTQEGIAPTAPESEPAACDDQCPTASDPSLLVSCTPSADGSFNSTCNATGRVEQCGGRSYCCPSPGGTWTTNMTACPTATITAAATAAPTAVVGTEPECSQCLATSECAAGLSCDLADGRCKKNDGSSVCYTSSAACTTTATSICVATATITCTPDCPTACGQKASTISTCTNSCGVATTKSCTATNACASDLKVTKEAYKNETSNTAGNYSYLTKIDTVSKDQIFTYDITVENTDDVNATDITVTDVLTGQKQDQLTFLDAHDECTYTSSTKTITCTGLDVDAGDTGYVSFRVKVSNGVANGEVIKNTATARVSGASVTGTKDLTVSTVVGCKQTCTTDSECGTGLVCDTDTSQCRKEACLEEDDCVCGVAVTPRATATVTRAAAATQAPAQLPGEGEAGVLPETGILDLPGMAAFGGGLLLAVVGILLAL